MDRPAAEAPQVEVAGEKGAPGLAAFSRFALWAGAVGFGGGLSVLAMLRSSAVSRGWLTEREFDDTATVAQMLPGGAAANALALMGLRFFGGAGAAAGYAGFILPGFAATLVLAVLYGPVGALPHAGAFLGGLSAAVVGIVASITLRMIRTSVGRPWQMGVAATALALSLQGGASSGELALLGVGAGLLLDLGLKRARLARTRRPTAPAQPAVGLPDEGQPLRESGVEPEPEPGSAPGPLRANLVLPLAAVLLGTAAAGSLLSLTLLFLRTGLGAYGGGFAIVPNLKATLVGSGALSERQFSDAVAIGKMTPGPVLLLATFIGYVKAGLPGALAATAAIFAAPLALTVALGAWLARYRTRRVVRAALRGLTPAVVGAMGAAAVSLATALDGTPEVAIAAATTMILIRFRASPALLIAGGGLLRLGLALVRG
jgi:chromate transporter